METGEFVAYNGQDGFNLHDIKTGNFIRTFQCKKLSNTAARPIQVAFIENATCVVIGSCQGTISVFETATGRLVQELTHIAKHHVQTVTVRLLSS